ncbi:DUF802 domain-containing protein [Stenotrophomonas sp. GZD-301]|uniref:DUF802 domain-containing protein n=1 Tax=Stenotrophomonas sp. GZD-301 TaxID=3404814 RepID=UPI003BB57B68
MFKNSLYVVVFLLGLTAVCWIGAGYVGSNPVGAAVALLIGACYLAGGVELYRYRQGTRALEAAVRDVAAAGDGLAGWLQRVPPALRHAVRLRVEGERIALPAPTLTPYLVGLLVLLGMLGTLLGMMATLRGTGLALAHATDLQAIRGSLGAPVEGLAVAFGTSIAGVATSAMLGLLSALCRRERLLAVQGLDGQIATTLHVHSQAHQRSETLRLLEQQAGVLPTLVERLQAMTQAIEQSSTAASERLLASQEAFHARMDADHARFADAVQATLQAGVADSARAIGGVLQPLLEGTLTGIVRENTTLQTAVGDAVQRQLDGLSAGFETSRAAAADHWTRALGAQREAQTALAADLRGALGGFAADHDARIGTLVETVSARLQDTVQQWERGVTEQQAAQHALASAQQDAGATLASALRADLAAAAARDDARTVALLDAVSARLQASADTWQAGLEAQSQTQTALTTQLGTALARFGERHDQRAADLLDALAQRLDAGAASAATAWQDALARQDSVNAALVERNQLAVAAAADALEARSLSLIEAMQQSHTGLQAALESRDTLRLTTWTAAFDTLSATLGERWERTGDQVAQRQQAICDTLAATAETITAQAQAHASDTISEISRLVQAASEAPKAAAEVVAELRQKLSDSMVHDTAMLEERSHLLATLGTLLDAVNHASTEQRGAVDALVSTSAELMERVGSRFTDHIAAETGKLDAVAAQVTGGAVDVASLADAFGTAMHTFGSASQGLGERLEQIAGALETTLARSDDQLAYYVAQAREVIDLSVLSQKQIIEELQALAGRGAAAETETA